MPELLAVLGAIYEKEKRHNTFMAAIQGIDINKDADSGIDKNEPHPDMVMPTNIDGPARTMQDIYAKVAKRLGGSDEQVGAMSMGFTPDMGTGYEVWQD